MHWFPYPTGPMVLLTLFWVGSFVLMFGAGLLLTRARRRPHRPTLHARPGTGPHVGSSPKPSA